jgi:O-antigen ligase
MNRPLFFSRCYFALIGIAVLSVPFSAILYFFITPLLLILWAIEGDWKRKWERLKTSRTWVVVCCLALFWLVNIIGLFYSGDMTRGLMRTYDKLPFLVYPLVFFTLDKTYFSKEKFHTLCKVFLCATVIMLLISWGRAFMLYFNTGQTQHFYYQYFSQLFGHPSYCALIVCIAFAIAFSFFNHKPHIAHRKSHTAYRIPHTANRKPQTVYRIPHTAYGALLVFFAVSIYFLQSRSGIAAFAIILFCTLFYYLHVHNKSLWKKIIGILIVLIFIVSIVKLFPNRVGTYVDKMDIEQLDTKKIFGQRTEIWSISYQLAMENKLLGIGTGYRVEQYLTETELEVFNKDRVLINAHNQFLQTFLEHGILGVCALLFLMIYSLFFSIKTKDYLLLMLMIGVIVNILFESMLERNHGIFIFALFYCLFMAKNNIFVDNKL